MKKGRITIDRNVCKGCKYCILFCPRKLIREDVNLNGQGYYPALFEDPEKKCIGCAICAKMCPEAAIEVFSEEIDAA